MGGWKLDQEMAFNSPCQQCCLEVMNNAPTGDAGTHFSHPRKLVWMSQSESGNGGGEGGEITLPLPFAASMKPPVWPLEDWPPTENWSTESYLLTATILAPGFQLKRLVPSTDFQESQMEQCPWPSRFRELHVPDTSVTIKQAGIRTAPAGWYQGSNHGQSKTFKPPI